MATKTNLWMWAGIAAGAGGILYLASKRSTMAAQLAQSALTVPSSPITSMTLSPSGLAVKNLDGTQTFTNSPAHAATLLSNHQVMRGMALTVMSKEG